ncbi:hypothetical protein RCL1_007691 [Eukaryota sp. TZLM3-RCL]
MGGLCSTSRRRNYDASPVSASLTTSTSPSVDPDLLRANSIFLQKSNFERLILPDDPTGNQICIEECKQSTIIICRVQEQVTIDDTHDSFIFIGPTTGPIFIRNCSNLRVVCICQQLRVRDCTGLKIAVLAKTKPIIETSQDVNFYCYFGIDYVQLFKQLYDSDISPYNNHWANVYDFSPAVGTKNFHIRGTNNTFTLPELISRLSHLKPLYSPTIPLVRGLRAPPPNTHAVAVIFCCKKPKKRMSLDASRAKSSVETLLINRNKWFTEFSVKLKDSVLADLNATTNVDNTASSSSLPSSQQSTVKILRTVETSLDLSNHNISISVPCHISPLFECGPVVAAEYGGPKGIAKKAIKVLSEMENMNPEKLENSLPIWILPGGGETIKIMNLLWSSLEDRN